jgi:hypothetical protein
MTIDPFVGFENEAAMELYRNSSSNRVLAGIVFDMVRYTIESFLYFFKGE